MEEIKMNIDREKTEIFENENGAAPQPSLEEAFGQLDKIIEKLQEPDAPLEEAFAAYQEGMKLLKSCSDRIDLVEKQVRVLNEEGDTDVLE